MEENFTKEKKMLLFASAKLSMKRAVRRMHETGGQSRRKDSKVKEDPHCQDDGT
jgi:hypothetical protein